MHEVFGMERRIIEAGLVPEFRRPEVEPALKTATGLSKPLSSWSNKAFGFTTHCHALTGR